MDYNGEIVVRVLVQEVRGVATSKIFGGGLSLETMTS